MTVWKLAVDNSIFFPFPGEWNAYILPSYTRWWDWLWLSPAHGHCRQVDWDSQVTFCFYSGAQIHHVILCFLLNSPDYVYIKLYIGHVHKLHFLALQPWPKRRTINGLNPMRVGDIERTMLIGFYIYLWFFKNFYIWLELE